MISNISHQLRADNSLTTAKDPGPGSLRSVFLNKVLRRFRPDPEFPDDHVSHLSRHQTRIVALIRFVRVEDPEERLLLDHLFARQPIAKTLDIGLIRIAKDLKTAVRSPKIPNFITPFLRRHRLQLGPDVSLGTRLQQSGPDTVRPEHQLKILFAAFNYPELAHDHEP